MSSGRLAVLNGPSSSRVRSSAAMPGGPETKLMASRAIAYRSAAHAAGGSALARGRPVPAGGSLSPALPPRPPVPWPAAVSASSMIWSMTVMSGCPVTTGTISASHAAASASLPAR